MSVRLSASAKVQAAFKKLLQSEHISIRDVANVIGLLVSSLPAVQYGELYYRKQEIDKSFALRQNQSDFDAPMILSDNSNSELLWWIANITGSHRSLIESNPDLVLTTDASLLVWGAVMNEKETGGQWSSVETKLHINYLEMKAVLLGLQSPCNDVHDIHICIQSDNTTALSYINSVGGCKVREL